jgi:neutral ceramidase
MPDTLRAGYAEADITPPLGTSMPGYFTDRKATGVLDPLKAKVIALGAGDESVAVVACDLVGVSVDVVHRIRDRVAKLPAAPRHIWVHATHTHTGGFLPRNDTYTSDAASIYPGFYIGDVDEQWVDRMIDRTAAAVGEAARAARDETKVTLHEGREATVAHIRRYVMKDGSVRTNPGRNNPNVVRPSGEIDPRLHVLRFEAARALLVIYGCHPDCVGGSKFSADYPHHLTEALRHALGAEWRVLFLNACCGNINHIDPNDANQKSGPEESKRIGQTLAVAALEALKKGQTIERPVLRTATAEVVSTLRKPDPADVKRAEALLPAGKPPLPGAMAFNGLHAAGAVVLARTKDREHNAEAATLRLGSFGLAFLPGEAFVELAREVEEASPFKPTRTIGLTNGAMGYIPTKRAYAEGGYEAGYRSARYEPDTGHRWAAKAGELLKGLAR